MKKLSIEQKAQRYDKAIERAKNTIEVNKTIPDIVECVESLFPELKESDDEMMVKFIKNQLFNIKKTITDNYKLDTELTKAIDWLEKQSDTQKKIDHAYAKGLSDAKKALEKQSEQKPVDKAELKFKVGDWVVNTVGDTNQVVKVFDDGYTLDDNTFLSNSWATEHYHLWTIQDAKDGDVLVHNDCTFIFTGIKDGIVQAIEENMLEHVPFGEPDKDNDYHPATKEQRDTLMNAIKEAGYEWDADAKQLKKVEQKHTEEYNITGIKSKYAQGKLGEMIKRKLEMEKQAEQKTTDVEPKFKVKYAGNEYNVLEIKDIAGITYYGIEDEPNHIDYVLPENCERVDGYSIKESGSPFPTKPTKFSEQKPTWSEEDIMRIDNLIAIIENRGYPDYVEYLERLKDRYTWKPSDGQMTYIQDAISKYNEFSNEYTGLVKLYNDLKKLRGE